MIKNRTELTPREKEVNDMMQKGYTINQIAEKLGVSKAYIRNTNDNIKLKNKWRIKNDNTRNN